MPAAKPSVFPAFMLSAFLAFRKDSSQASQIAVLLSF
jgi:hypothetical protein